MPTSQPRSARASARFRLTVDLPTPPLPLVTAIVTTARIVGRGWRRAPPPSARNVLVVVLVVAPLGPVAHLAHHVLHRPLWPHPVAIAVLGRAIAVAGPTELRAVLDRPLVVPTLHVRHENPFVLMTPRLLRSWPGYQRGAG